MPTTQSSAPASTVVLFDQPAVAAADLRGGGPGTRESALLDPAMTVERIDAIALAGGSAFGLDAASGAQAWLREQGRGFAGARRRACRSCRARSCSICLNGGDKNWGRYPPYRELGYAATAGAAADFALGSVGAGLGATTADLKGGIGSASAQTRRRHDRRRAGRGQCRRQRRDRRRAAFLGRRLTSATANSAGAACPRRCRRRRSPSRPRASPARTPRWSSSPPTRP